LAPAGKLPPPGATPIFELRSVLPPWSRRRDHNDTTEPVVVVAITGLIVIPIRRQQIRAVVVVPATTPKHAVASRRTASSTGVCAGIPPGFNLSAKFLNHAHSKKFRPLRGEINPNAAFEKGRFARRVRSDGCL